MSSRDIIVVGASAGGVEALSGLVGGLAGNIPAAVFVVLHIPRRAPSALPGILDRAGPLPARHAEDGELVLPGRIYVAPSDHHLVLRGDRVALTTDPTQNGHRPAIDPLFRSAARYFGPRVVGVVLSGARDDGAAGLESIARQGGITVVQDPEEAQHPSMPRAALDAVEVDHVLGTAEMGPLLTRIAGSAAGPATPAPPEAEDEMTDPVNGLTPVGLSCPACDGPMFELRSPSTPRFRCRVGHRWSPESLLDGQTDALESALWVAYRSLQDKVALSRRMARSAAERGRPASSSRYERVAEETDRAGTLLRGLIDRMNRMTDYRGVEPLPEDRR
ncbi:chemotaxis protein CheB [Allokutzneria albata]|uniref:protein-glutamate methylesterase n=1 Tax=Allokutzneria albata TaxID=211114 RepID=A0A1G9R4C5_ALLAB|nr:chemotaxis protein CheB [Allokutzneria albata]SDM17275.1 two-component system, chemotaxis family, response regulator CheB [Allokutzneria albata]